MFTAGLPNLIAGQVMSALPILLPQVHLLEVAVVTLAAADPAAVAVAALPEEGSDPDRLYKHDQLLN